MLISAVVELRPRADAPPPHYTGRMAHGWFLSWVSAVDPACAATLHACRQAKPFTVSGLQDQSRPVWLRITSIERDLSAWLIKHLDADLPGVVTIGGRAYDVLAVSIVPGQHPWAGQTTYRDLVDGHFCGREAPGKIALLFASPTTFRSGGVNVPLPVPDLVFGSLADRWTAYAPVSLDDAIRVVASGRVVTSRYRLQTRAVPIKEGYQVGFTGSCEFSVLAENPYWRQVCALLADFALYSGIGHKTALGLGQARRLQRCSRADAFSRQRDMEIHVLGGEPGTAGGI